MPPSVNVPEIDFADEPTKTAVPEVPPDYTYYPDNPPQVILDDDDLEFTKPKTEPEDFFIDDDEIMIELPKEDNEGDTFTSTSATTEIKTEVFDDGQKIVQKNTKVSEKIKIKSRKKIKNRPNPYGQKKKVKLSKPPHLPGQNLKPYAKVVPAQHPSILFNKLINAQRQYDNDIQISNAQETDNQNVTNQIKQAEHPAVAFRQMTTAQRDKAELK